MKLVSLTLENIKSYRQETLDFYEGVNFISGANGAGKSTIIEAIGYVLFDTRPFSNVRQFIREGEKTGLISLVFEANDERLYRIVRRLRSPSGGSWGIFDVESGAELTELHGNQDVKDWLAESLGLNKDLDPSLLFEDVIGISQGKFTAPFLERDAIRKKIFNTILQLEGYREVFDKTSGLGALLDKNISQKENDQNRLLERIADLEECKGLYRQTVELRQVLQAELQSIKAELERSEREIGVQEHWKAQAEKTEHEGEGLKIRLAGITEQKERLTKELSAALSCQEKAKTALAGYQEFLRLQGVRQNLESRRKSKEKLETKRQALQNQVSTLAAELQSEKENRTKQSREMEFELQELKTEGEKAVLLTKEAAEKKEQAEVRLEKLAAENVNWRVLEEIINRSEQEQGLLRAAQENERLVNKEIQLAEDELGAWEETEKTGFNLAALEEEDRSVQNEISQLEGKIESLAENKRNTQGGNCPFLQVPCKNVEEGLEEHFAKEIERLLPQLEELRLKKAQMAAQLQIGKRAKEKLTALQRQAEAQIGQLLQKYGSEYSACETRLNYLRERYKKVSGALAQLRDDTALQKKEALRETKAQELQHLADLLTEYADIDREWEENKSRLARQEPFYIQYIQNAESAGKLESLQQEQSFLLAEEKQRRLELEKKEEYLQSAKLLYKPDLLLELKSQRDVLVGDKGKKEGEYGFALQEAERLRLLIAEKEKTRQEIIDLEQAVTQQKKAQELLRMVRNTLNQAGDKIAEVYRQYLGREADILYQQIANENVHLTWVEDYEVKIIDQLDGSERERTFTQLSGGEKMSAAVAVRLALLQQLSGLGIGFFDEPTANLDEKRRSNLARIIPHITGNFRQIFIISHDDTFDAITENVILLRKEAGKGTKVFHE